MFTEESGRRRSALADNAIIKGRNARRGQAGSPSNKECLMSKMSVSRGEVLEEGVEGQPSDLTQAVEEQSHRRRREG